MAVGDDMMMEGSASSFILDIVESKQSRDVVSPEVVAWADSCLVKDSEISDINWDSLKAALLDIANSQQDPLDFSAAGRDGFTGGTDFEILPSGEEAQTLPNLGMTIDDDDLCNEEVEQNSDDYYIVLDKVDQLKSITELGNPFPPNYTEELEVIENIDPGLDFGFPVFVTESSSADIFRVWDLDIPAEEDELIKQLNKALAESSLQPMPATLDGSGGWRDLKEESLDDLIAGIEDLSLNQNSG